MEQFIEQTLDWISHNTAWAGISVLIIAFLESMAILGLFIPGWLFLVGIGSLIGTGHLNFYSMAIYAFIGAIIGESLSYFLGYYYRDTITHWKLLRKHQSLVESSEKFFKRYGIVSIILGRFFGPIRAIIPLVAGIFLYAT